MTATEAKSKENKTDAPKRTEPLPPLPKSLPKGYQTEWRCLVQHLRDNGNWVPQKSGLVEAYLANLKAVRESEAALQRDGVIMADGKQNPTSAVLVRHTATLNKPAVQLALGKGKVAAPASAAPEKPTASAWEP